MNKPYSAATLVLLLLVVASTPCLARTHVLFVSTSSDETSPTQAAQPVKKDVPFVPTSMEVTKAMLAGDRLQLALDGSQAKASGVPAQMEARVDGNTLKSAADAAAQGDSKSKSTLSATRDPKTLYPLDTPLIAPEDEEI